MNQMPYPYMSYPNMPQVPPMDEKIMEMEQRINRLERQVKRLENRLFKTESTPNTYSMDPPKDNGMYMM